MDLTDNLPDIPRCIVSTVREGSTFEEVLKTCNLKTERGLYQEIDRDTACRYLTRIFYADLAYNVPVMSLDEAVTLAQQFLALFSVGESRYYSNATRIAPGEHDGLIRLESWNPIGNATFDWGVVVVSPERAGCLCTEDED